MGVCVDRWHRQHHPEALYSGTGANPPLPMPLMPALGVPVAPPGAGSTETLLPQLVSSSAPCPLRHLLMCWMACPGAPRTGALLHVPRCLWQHSPRPRFLPWIVRSALVRSSSSIFRDVPGTAMAQHHSFPHQRNHTPIRC